MIYRELEESIKTKGADRVIVDSEGQAVRTPLAYDRGITPVIFFIRDDGWTLGAPIRFASIAESTWSDKWVGVYTKDRGVITYEEFKKSKPSVLNELKSKEDTIKIEDKLQ